MAAKQPSVRFTLLLEKYPTSLGTTTYRWSHRPLADTNAWSEGRIISWGAVERGSSTPDGDYDICTADVEIDDSDGLIRGLLADVTTRYFTNREAAIEVLSEAGRAASLAWRPITRGRVTDVQAKPGRTASIRIADAVGSHFSGFDLEKTIGVRITRQEHPNAGDKVVNRIYPIIIGEHSDIGAVDENGAAADKGMLPVIDTGDYLLDEDGNIFYDTPFAYLAAPANLTSTTNGTPGLVEITYSVTAVSPYGETTVSTVTVTDAPATLNGTDNIDLSWDEQAGTVEFRVYKNGKLLARLNNDEMFVDPETTYTDDGSDTVSAITPPQTNTAQVDQVIDGVTASGWGRLILKIGRTVDVHRFYGSNLAEGTAPKRVALDDVVGSEVLYPGGTGWPHATDYITINGIDMIVAYARGPRLKHHRDGTVTFAWSGCGDHSSIDNEVIDQAFLAEQHILNEYVLKNGGVGYRSGDFGPLETYSNGVEKLKTSAFAACQALTVTWVGGTGYLCAIAITEPQSVREFLRRFHVTFASHTTSNHHGQCYPFLIDDTVAVTAGRAYRDRIEVMAMVSQDIDHDAVETKVTYHYDWDADAQKFRVSDEVIEDEAATEAHGGVARERAVRQCYYTRDSATALDSNSRHLTRFKVAPRRVGIKTDFLGLEDENGAQIRLTHYDGAGGVNGDVATPMIVMTHRTVPQAPEHVVLTCWDLSRILTTGFPLLGDKTSIAGDLYDKTVMATPTAGAYELR